MIDRRLLRYFLAVIDYGNFSKAAVQCRVSQPSLSAGIVRLEELVGQPLFRRTSRRVEITPAGIRLADHARRIESEFRDAERGARSQKMDKPIRIGVIPTLPAFLLERAIGAAGATTPSASPGLEIVEGRMRELELMVDRGRLDVLIGTRGTAPHDELLFTETYAMAFATTHRLAGRASISAEDVAQEPMLVRRNCEALPEISRYFASRGIRPFMAARTTNEERAVAFVRAGLAITVFPQCFAQSGLEMVSVSGIDRTRTVGFRFAPESRARLGTNEAFQALTAALRS